MENTVEEMPGTLVEEGNGGELKRARQRSTAAAASERSQAGRVGEAGPA